MTRLGGRQVLMRIFIGESDTHGGMPLYQAIVDLLRKEGIAGATVLRGVAGYGASSVYHTSHLLRLSQDLPLVIEAVDTEENVQRVVPKMDALVEDGLITLERVDVIVYRRGGDGGASDPT